MNISDIDCPQYVCFQTMGDASTISVDSLEPAERSEVYDPEDMISGDLSFTPSMLSAASPDATLQEVKNSNCLEVTNGYGVIEGDLSGYSDLKENYPVNCAKILPGKVHHMQPKNTVPKPFTFQTDNRLKSKEKETEEYEKKDFVSALRQNNIVHNTVNRITKVKPFNLTESKKRKHETGYQSMAEQVVAFQKKTPERFHSSSQKGFQPQEHWEPPSLVPKSPKLQAVKRRRVVTALSKEQEEDKEIADMAAYEFHAKPVDPKIYKPPVEIKKKVKVSAKSKNFHLQTAQRANALHGRRKSEKKYQFKARPVPKAILTGTTGLKEKQVIPLTQPKAPDFVIDNRLEKRKEHEIEKKAHEEKECALKKQSTKPKPPPQQSSVPYSKKRTEVEPFSFDRLDKQRFSQKEKRIQEELENESKPYIFRAQVMPFPKPDILPSVPKKQTTEPEPFKFLLDNRGLRNHQTFSEENTSSFKAQPATVLKKEPFVPEKSLKPIIEVQEFNLHTDRRASARQLLKEIKDKEEQERQELLQMQKAKEEEMERLELLKLRKELVHKANPVKQFKPVEIKPSSVPLTEPLSPDFETEKRLQSKH